MQEYLICNTLDCVKFCKKRGENRIGAKRREEKGGKSVENGDANLNRKAKRVVA